MTAIDRSGRRSALEQSAFIAAVICCLPFNSRLGERYTMLTVNADAHPLMSRMHKPDPKLPTDQQDKRSVVAIEQADAEQWLLGSTEEIKALLHAPAMYFIEGAPI